MSRTEALALYLLVVAASVLTWALGRAVGGFAP